VPRFDRTRDDSATCPACTNAGLEHFYQVDDVPTSSNLLMPTRQEAINWPRDNLRLAYCRACEFITMLCEMADETGWGHDPIIEPGRTPA